VKCALNYRIPPEDEEMDEIAREKPGHLETEEQPKPAV
jgi:hypothetical protein